MDFDSLLEIRDARAEDMAFIFATWLRGLRYGCDWWRECDQGPYFKHYHYFLEKLLDRPGIAIKIACLKDEPDTFVSYAVYQSLPNALSVHWVFTKKAWRKLGIAKRLIPENVTQCSHLTTVGRAIKPATWTFNPFEM